MARGLHAFPIAALLLSLAAGTGCTRLYELQPYDPLPKAARVGVISMGIGSTPKYTWNQRYLAKAFAEAGLVYVPISDFDASRLILPRDTTVAVNPAAGEEGLSAAHDASALLRNRLKTLGLSHVVLLDVSASNNKDFDLKASLVRVEDMAVVGFREYSRNHLTPICSSLFFLGPIEWAVCFGVAYGGFDAAQKEAELVRDLLLDFSR